YGVRKAPMECQTTMMYAASIRQRTFPMPMPISRASLEAECLRVTRKQQGCRGTHAVTIKRLHPEGSGPNWEPQQIYPALDKVAEHYARRALAELREI